MQKKSRQHFVIPMLLLILAYEWIISAANKLVAKNYYQNLHQQLAQSLSGIQVKPYADLVKNVGLSHYHVIGALVVLSELFVGVSFVILGIWGFLGRTNRSAGWIGWIASIMAAFMSLNYALLGGDTLFVDPDNAFQEGISIDWVLFLVEVTLAIYFYSLASDRSTVREDAAQQNVAGKIRASEHSVR